MTTLDAQRLTAAQTANRIFDHCDRRRYAIGTVRLLTGIGLEDGQNRGPFRRLLQRLADCGHMKREGTAKLKWTLLSRSEDWDRDNPFRPRAGATPPVPEIPAASDSGVAALRARVSVLEDKITAVATGGKVGIEVRHYNGKIINLEDACLPKVFERVLSLAAMRRNILLVGPAGCGKTTIAELVSRSLGLPFGKVGGSGGLSETDLLGRHTPNLSGGPSHFETTAFVRRYEEGGVMLVDELDAADQNVLLALNPALDRSGRLPLPKRTENPEARRHDDFVCIATANTFGRGATRQYAGRNQLDEATLDRFRIGVVECCYDETVEARVCPNDSLRNQLRAIRRRVEESGLRRVVSTRFMEDAHVMTSAGGWNADDVIAALYEGWTAEEKAKIQR
jgi:MoxR-like ATPase